MVLGKLPCRGVLLIWIIVGQGPTAFAVGAGGKVGWQIPPLVFTGGIYRYLPIWKILLKWQIPANTGKLIFFFLP